MGALPRPGTDIVVFGVFEADLRGAELRKQGVKVKLQEQPFQVLRLLLERPGQLVSREEMRQKIWPRDTFVDFDHGLNNAVARLRQALGDSAENPRFIETLSRRGYRFIGLGQAVSGQGTVTAGNAKAAAAVAVLQVPAVSRAGKGPLTPALRIAVLIFCVLTAMSVTLGLRFVRARRSAGSTASVVSPPPLNWKVVRATLTYSTLDLPESSGTGVFGINDKGEVVGASSVEGSSGLHNQGFLFREGRWGLVTPEGARSSRATGINNRGWIVGSYTRAGVGHGFLLTQQALTNIDFPGADLTQALGINARGQVVGAYTDSAGKLHGFVYSDGNYNSVDYSGAPSAVLGINSHGDLVGQYDSGSPSLTHGFAVINGSFRSIDLPGASQTMPLGVNADGDIAGAWQDGTGNLHGMVFSNGTFTVFDVPGARTTTAQAINSSGQIVGRYLDGDQVWHGYVGTLK